MRPAADPLRLRIINCTGSLVMLFDPKGALRDTLESVGAARWQNASLPLAGDFVGVPRFDFRMNYVGGLPPVAPRFHPERYPAYVLVDVFTAMALAAVGIKRPDVLVPVSYVTEAPPAKIIRVYSLGHVPL